MIQRLIARWTEHGIACPSGVSASALAAFESDNNCVLPKEVRAYFTTVNGMGDSGTCDDDFFSFRQLSDVESIARFVPDRADRFADASRYFIIADHSISLPSFAIRLNPSATSPSPVASVYTDQGALDVEVVFDSFTEFLRSYLDNPVGTSATFPRGD